jgi:hypothetical protein
MAIAFFWDGGKRLATDKSSPFKLKSVANERCGVKDGESGGTKTAKGRQLPH